MKGFDVKGITTHKKLQKLTVINKTKSYNKNKTLKCNQA